MALLADSIKSIVSIQIKRRDDSISDQYNRIFMTKMSILFSAIIGFNYFSDTVSCIIANADGMKKEFVGSACWIQGFYVYKEMAERLKDSSYFGIPRNMDFDGLDETGRLCSVIDRAQDKVDGCYPMEKVYYLQYQYMPFLTASFAMFFYLPYIIFKVTNTDLVSLKDDMKNKEKTADDIIQGYFDQRLNSKRRMRYRVVMIILVKILYLFANIVSLAACNRLLNGHYIRYGINLVRWASLTNQEAHDHSLKIRAMAKPGNVLLPPMGFCDLQEASRDVRNTRINYHKILCEMSPHILYQYVLFVYWFLLIIGIVISLLGILSAFCGHLINFVIFAGASERSRRALYKRLTTREIDYLEYIRRKNMTMYSEVLARLKGSRGCGNGDDPGLLMEKKCDP